MARASWVPLHKRTIQCSKGTKQVETSRSWRLVPALSEASLHHSYKRCSTLASLWSRSKARKVATVPRPQQRVKAMPKLHSAKTVAWGLLRCGKVVDTVVVHSDNWSWRDTGSSCNYGCLGTSIVAATVFRFFRQKPTPKRGWRYGQPVGGTLTLSALHQRLTLSHGKLTRNGQPLGDLFSGAA